MPLLIEKLFLLITRVGTHELSLILQFLEKPLLYCSFGSLFSYLFAFNAYPVLLGLDLLLEFLQSASLKQQQDGSAALYKLATKTISLSPMDAAPLSPTPQVPFLSIYIVKFWSIYICFSLGTQLKYMIAGNMDMLMHCILQREERKIYLTH